MTNLLFPHYIPAAQPHLHIVPTLITAFQLLPSANTEDHIGLAIAAEVSCRQSWASAGALHPWSSACRSDPEGINVQSTISKSPIIAVSLILRGYSQFT
jgi:hypothetical protein